MTEDEKKQARYQAKRPQAGPAYPTIEYRIFLPDGSERVERAIGLSQIAAHYPEAIMVQRVDAVGGFF